MNIKKVLKVTAVALTSIIILIVISAYLTFISFLPSPQKMAQSLKSASTELSTIETNKPKVDQKNEIEQPENSNTPAALTNNSEKNSKDQVENIRNMLNEDPRDIRVCENLGQSKTTDNKASKEESFDLSKVFSEEMRQDSVVESYRFAVRKIFQDEAISPLLNELLDLSNQQISVQETDSYLKKINFYSRAAYAAASLYAKKSTLQATLSAFNIETKFTSYCFSKIALIAATKILARDAPNNNVLINTLCPGHCGTDINNFATDRTAAEGAQEVVLLALLPAGSTVNGRFYRNGVDEEW